MTRQQACMLCAFLLLPGTGFTIDGETLFNARCLQCHSPGAAGLKSLPETARQILTNGSIRKHRFSLSADEVEALINYLVESRGQ